MTLLTNHCFFCMSCCESNCVNWFPYSSWTSWLIPALIATIIGIICRYYMSDSHTSSWVLPSQIHPILIIRRPSNQTNPHHTEHAQSGVCASTAKEWEEFERVVLCLHMQVHHVDSLVNPCSIVCLSLSLHSYYACWISTCAVLCSVFPANSVTSHISWDATNTVIVICV